MIRQSTSQTDSGPAAGTSITRPVVARPGRFHRGHFCLPVVAAAAALFLACGEPILEPPVDTADAAPGLLGGGSWNPAQNFGGPWGHDGEPLVTEHYMVFSGHASIEARQRVADIAEESLAEIFEQVGVTTDEFDWQPGWDPQKIHILALADQDFRSNSGFAYRDGLVIISDEHPNYQNFGFDSERHKRLIKHESYHVVEFLLIGDPQYQQGNDVWLREGMAQYVSRPRPDEITTREQLDTWRADHAELVDAGNPIAVHVWSDFPDEIVSAGQTFSYYQVFELAVRYLLDENGHGASARDLVRIYDDLGRGLSFPVAFELHMGMSLQSYEDNFWALMNGYLATVGTP